jgi:hypothetical protein
MTVLLALLGIIVLTAQSLLSVLLDTFVEAVKALQRRNWIYRYILMTLLGHCPT